jgi:hypothetical protein
MFGQQNDDIFLIVALEVFKWRRFSSINLQKKNGYSLYCILCHYVITETSVQVYKCTCVQVCKCTSVQMYKCTNAKVYKCTSVQIYKRTSVQMYKCTSVQVYKCVSVQAYKCKVYKCTNI